MTDDNFKSAPMARTAHRIRSKLDGRSLVLVGLMGAGKSTIGKRIATILDLPFFDADIEIEKAAQMTIPDLFERYGESEFRDLERRVIARLMTSGSMVLATGGGAYMNAQTRQTISEGGISIWLNAELDVLVSRVIRRKNRPLLLNKDPHQVLRQLMEERYPVYALTDLTVMSRDAKRDVIARDVIKTLDKHLSKPEAAKQEQE